MRRRQWCLTHQCVGLDCGLMLVTYSLRRDGVLHLLYAALQS